MYEIYNSYVNSYKFSIPAQQRNCTQSMNICKECQCVKCVKEQHLKLHTFFIFSNQFILCSKQLI